MGLPGFWIVLVHTCRVLGPRWLRPLLALFGDATAAFRPNDAMGSQDVDDFVAKRPRPTWLRAYASP